MERLLSVKDICERYQVKPVTGRKIMRQMRHIEGPLMVYERDVKAWEHSRTVPGAGEIREMMKKGGGRRAG